MGSQSGDSIEVPRSVTQQTSKRRLIPVHAIRISTKAVEHYFFTGAIHFEHSAAIVCASQKGGAVEIARPVPDQASKRPASVSATHAAETVKHNLLTVSGQFEHGTLPVGASLARSPKKISRRILNQPSFREATVHAILH